MSATLTIKFCCVNRQNIVNFDGLMLLMYLLKHKQTQKDTTTLHIGTYTTYVLLKSKKQTSNRQDTTTIRFCAF